MNTATITKSTVVITCYGQCNENDQDFAIEIDSKKCENERCLSKPISDRQNCVVGLGKTFQHVCTKIGEIRNEKRFWDGFNAQEEREYGQATTSEAKSL